MQQADFEQAVLRMAQQGGMQRLTPQAVGYRLGMEVKDAERMLDRMVTSARLELDSDDDGNLYYFVPGHGTPGVFTTGVPLDPVPVAQENAAQGTPWGPPPSASGGAPAPGSAPQPAPGAVQAPWGTWPGQQQPAQSGYGTPHPANAPQQSAPPNTGYPPGAPQSPGQYGQPWAAGQYGQPWNPQQQPAGPPAAFGGPAPWGPQGPGSQPNPYAQPPHGAPYGAPYQAPGPQYAYGQNALVPTRGPDGPRSPATAALLGLIPGAGQLYNGQVGKGLTLFFLTGFLSAFPPLAVVPWVWGIVDAHSTARRQNQQHYGLLGP